MRILGIETSCDETAASVLEIKRGRFNILSNVISSQIKVHQKYGGVVPELAARKHTENIIPVIDVAVGTEQCSVPTSVEQCSVPTSVDAIAVVTGPGLVTSLMVGVETAKTLAWTWKVPLIPINHLEAHLYANWLSVKPSLTSPYSRRGTKKAPPFQGGVGVVKFPALCLLVSGGHTELILMKDHGKYQIIGETLDDAAGEAFDKVAKLLKLPYPGGPNVAKLAEKGNPAKINLPRPLINSNDFNFSFSGLKTAVARVVVPPLIGGVGGVADICASFQQAVIDVLIAKTIKATKKYKVKTVMLAGGVAANKELRRQMKAAVETRFIASNISKDAINRVSTIFPDPKFCTDNAVMVAMAGYFRYNRNLKPYNLEKIKINPNLSL
jgi:N6-L-threonylcarbamoyladenine synthase